MPAVPPPVARRAALLAAAALVALGTLAYAFATRGPLDESAETPLAPDSVAAQREDPAGPCLSVDIEAFRAVDAALALGCATATSPTASAPAPTLPVPPPTGAPANGSPATPAPSGPGTQPPSADDDHPALPRPTPFPTPWPTTDPDASRGGDASSEPARDEKEGDEDERGPGVGHWTWWTPPEEPAPWPEGLYDALAPFLSPPGPVAPPPAAEPAQPPPVERCASVCDPFELDGSAAQRWSEDRVASPPTRVGLLARALDAFDAYVRLRD